jgi:tetrahydromethanopterin S-methyltransferase subunit B
MDSEGNLLADKFKDTFRKHQEPVANKVAELENFVDTCISNNGEFKLLCFLN